MKNLAPTVLLLLFAFSLKAQPPQQYKAGTSFSFIDYQKTFPRPSEAMERKADTLQKQFEKRKLQWPAKYIYIRSFKYDSQLEVWVKNDVKDPYQLFKTYRVCAMAGTLGPKEWKVITRYPRVFIISTSLIRK